MAVLSVRVVVIEDVKLSVMYLYRYVKAMKAKTKGIVCRKEGRSIRRGWKLCSRWRGNAGGHSKSGEGIIAMCQALAMLLQ